MNTVELLLKGDAGKLAAPEKEVEITRLSKKMGGPVIFKLRAISHAKYEEIQDSVTINSNGEGNIGNDTDKKAALAGIIDPDLKSKELKEHYSAITPEELLKNLLLPGEIATIAKEVLTLSGFNNHDAVKEIKN